MGWIGVALMFIAFALLSSQNTFRAPLMAEEPCPPALLPADSLPPGLGVPMMGPLDGQKKPPCKGPNEKGLKEHQLLGACWYRMEGEPPCGEGYQNGNSCYAPVPARLKVPSTTGLEPQGGRR